MSRQSIFDQANIALGGIHAVFLVLALMIAPYIVSVITNIGRKAGPVVAWERAQADARHARRRRPE